MSPKRDVSAPLLPAYLMVGGDELKQRSALARLDARLEATGGDPEFNREVLDGTNPPEEAQLRAMLDTLPFGSDFRLVVLKDVDKAPKATTEALVSYLGNPCPSTVLAMTAAKLPKSTRLYKAVAALGATAVLDCAPKKRREIPQQVVGMARSRGKAMDVQAADLLVRLLGESTLMLDNEVGKLAVALGSKPIIEESDVRRLVTRVSEVKPWDFLDAVAQRDPAQAARMLSLMPSQSPVGLFSLTVTRLRELVCAKALARRGSTQSLASELGLQAWQVKNHAAWARNYTMDELTAALRSAPACEEALKTLPDKQLSFQRWVFSFCTAPRGR